MAGSNPLSTLPIASEPLGVLASYDLTTFDVLQTVISQYTNSPIILALVQSMAQWLDPSVPINLFFDTIWNIDTAVGYGLDVWGRIVGVSRVLQVPVPGYFGFEGDTAAVPFGQGPFYLGGASTTNYALTDEAYRKLIFAKAMLNITSGGIPAINQILLNLFGEYGDVYVTDGLDMTMTYTFPSAISAVDYAIVTQSGVLPKPIGVSFTVVQ